VGEEAVVATPAPRARRSGRPDSPAAASGRETGRPNDTHGAEGAALDFYTHKSGRGCPNPRKGFRFRHADGT
jgi:hypothetical protein